MNTATTLDQLKLNESAEIASVDWTAMSDAEGARLRALGLDEGVLVEKQHRGMFGSNDPIALKVGRMKIAVRKSHAIAITVQSVTVTA